LYFYSDIEITIAMPVYHTSTYLYLLLTPSYLLCFICSHIMLKSPTASAHTECQYFLERRHLDWVSLLQYHVILWDYRQTTHRLGYGV